MSQPAPKPEEWSVAPYFLVHDVVSSGNYYRDVLGFRFDRFWGDPPSFCMVRRGGIVIMLAQVASDVPVRPNTQASREGGAWDAYVWVNSADGLLAELMAKGANIARPICDQPYGCRDFDILDCNGYRLCFGEDIS